MSIQISGDQIKNNAVAAGKLDLSTGTFDFTSATIRAASPSNDSDVAIKSYVDSLAASGVFWKESVRAATTAAINISSDLQNGDSIDGVTLQTGDRVLVKDQSGDSEKQNGIYIVVAAGAASRSSDMDAADEFSGSAVFVQEGSANADQGYICTNNGNVVVGTTAIQFTQFTGLGQITAGAALTKSNNTLNVAVDDSSIEISSDALRVKALGISSSMLAGSIPNSKLQNATISGVALGSNLLSLSKATNGGVNFTSYNGSAAVSNLQLDISDLAAAAVNVAADSIAIYDSDADVTAKESIADLITAVAGAGLAASSGVLSVGVDDNSIEINGDALRVKANGIASSMLAGSIPTSKLLLQTQITTLTPNGSTAAFDLDHTLTSNTQLVLVFRNGICIKQVSSSPSGTDEYTINPTGGTGGVALVTFGGNISASDDLKVFYVI